VETSIKERMNAEGLDWSAPELLSALQAENCNGFGFQCDSPQSWQPTRIYIAQPFNPRGDVDLAVVRNALPHDIPHEDLWITDFIGHDFVTVHTRQYLNIPRILDTFLACGYGFVTHTCVKVRYLPGDQPFTRLGFERKLIAQLREEHREWERLRKREVNTWKVVLDFNRPFPLIQHWNWATPEGRELCSELRRALHKKSERCKHDPRMMWPKYAEVAQRYGILHVGGWSAYDTGLAQPAPAPEPMQQDDDEDEVLCMVCLSEPPDTIAQPCGHICVCHACSDKLAATNTVNKTRCMQCQKRITHVEK
jgi:hypothetical protein